jgi:hypothetical protein
MGVAIPDDLRERLIAESTVRGVSIAEEIRRRLENSYKEDDFYASRPDLRELVLMVLNLASMAEQATGRNWNEDDATGYLLGLAINRHLERHGAEEVEEIETTEKFQSKGDRKSHNPALLAEMIESIAHLMSQDRTPDYDAFRADRREILVKKLRRLNRADEE